MDVVSTSTQKSMSGEELNDLFYVLKVDSSFCSPANNLLCWEIMHFWLPCTFFSVRKFLCCSPFFFCWRFILSILSTVEQKTTCPIKFSNYLRPESLFWYFFIEDTKKCINSLLNFFITSAIGCSKQSLESIFAGSQFFNAPIIRLPTRNAFVNAVCLVTR